MVQPFDYRTKQPDFLGSYQRGFEFGSARQDRRRQMEELQRQDQARASFDEALQGLGDNYSSRDLMDLMVKNPAYRAAIEPSFKNMTDQERKNQTNIMYQVYSLLDSNNPEAAASNLEEYATLYEQQGDTQNANELRTLQKIIGQSPQAAQKIAGLGLAGIMSPEQFGTQFGKLEEARTTEALRPSQIAEGQGQARKVGAEAQIAETEAAYAPVMAEQQLDINDAQIKETLASAMDKEEQARLRSYDSETSRIQTQLASETNDLKRQQLQVELQQTQREQQELLQSKQSEINTQLSLYDTQLDNINQILNDDNLSNVLGVIEGGEGKLAGIANFGPKDRASIARIETLKNQQFITNLLSSKEGGANFGALTNEEGQKLIGLIQSLDRTMSPDDFKKAVSTIEMYLQKGRANIGVKYGVALPAPDLPNAVVSTPELDGLAKRYGTKKRGPQGNY